MVDFNYLSRVNRCSRVENLGTQWMGLSTSIGGNKTSNFWSSFFCCIIGIITLWRTMTLLAKLKIRCLPWIWSSWCAILNILRSVQELDGFQQRFRAGSCIEHSHRPWRRRLRLGQLRWERPTSRRSGRDFPLVESHARTPAFSTF